MEEGGNCQTIQIDRKLFFHWLQQYGLPTDGSADYLDSDGDGMNNLQEWRCSTDPTNAISALRVISITNKNSGLVVTWSSVNLQQYRIERATNLAELGSFFPVKTNITGFSGTQSYTDLTATNVIAYFYRVGVEP